MNRRLALALLAALAWPALAAAQAIDLSSGGPVEVTARGGFEWRENEQIVIATGDARAVRQNVVVTADKLIAYYRKKAQPGATQAAAAQAAATQSADATDTGGNEVYRLEAEGHVLITTPTDQAQGDHAIYDIDQAVLVLTGHDLKLTTPQDVLTARDSLEYWSQKHMAVGRGNAVVVTTDGKRLSADVLVGYTADTGNAPHATPAAADGKPASSNDTLATSGKLERVEAFGNVEVRTATDIVHGDRGVYVTATGIARIIGHVRITHGQNQMEGPAADVNMKTGVAHLISDPGQRVQGLIMPNDAQAATGGAAKGGKP